MATTIVRAGELPTAGTRTRAGRRIRIDAGFIACSAVLLLVAFLVLFPLGMLLWGSFWTSRPGFPGELSATDALWKVFGRGADDVWMVGTGGKLLHWDGESFAPSFVGRAESLFTVHGNGARFAAVGGFGTGLLMEHPSDAPADAPWQDVSPAGAPSLIGVCLTERGGYAVGEFGYVAARGASGWATEVTGLEVLVGSRNLHSVWIDERGGVWAAGGQVRVPPLENGILLHREPAPVVP